MRKVKDNIGGPIVAPRANWANNVSESLNYMTSIITSRAHREQREALRPVPRHVLQYTFDAFDDLAVRIEGDVEAWPGTDGLFYVVAPYRLTRLSGPHQVGFTVLTLDESVPWWIEVGTFLVIETEDVREVVEVESVSASSVTIASGIQTDFSDGTLVYGALKARYSEETQLSSVVNTHYGGALRFTVDPDQVLPLAPTPTTGSHRGFPVFDFKPNWSSPPKRAVTADRFTFDSDTGLMSTWRRNDFSLLQIDMDYTPLSKATYEKIQGFFHDRKGRRGSFWLPSQMRDMTVAENQDEGTSSLTVRGADIHNFFKDSETRKVVMVRWPDGCWQMNTLNDMNIVDGQTVISFEDSWGRDIAAGTDVSWCFLTRFASDTLSAEWLTNEHVSLTVPFSVQPTAPLFDGGGGGSPIIRRFGVGRPGFWGNGNTATFPLAALPAWAVDQELATISGSASIYAETNPPGYQPFPAEGRLYIRIRYLDENLSLDSGTESEDVYFINGRGSVSITRPIKPGHAYVQITAGATFTLQSFSYIVNDNGSASVTSPLAGNIIIGSGDVQCP